MKRQTLLFFALLLAITLPTPLGAQAADTTGVDTTGQGYRIGYTIGSWLPFLVIFTLALLVILRSARLSREKR